MDPKIRYLVLTLKILFPVVLIGWLLSNIPADQWEGLRSRPKDWSLLLAAFVAGTVSVVLTFWRWQLLVQALNISFGVKDAFRLGFLGYLFNFVSVGAVGGDLFKAFFIAKERPGRRTEAVASVFVDRVIGLYALLLLTGLVVVCKPPTNVIARQIANLSLVGVLIGGIGIIMMFIPGFTQGKFSSNLCRIPKVGHIAERLLLAVRLYRTQPRTLFVNVVISLCVHVLTTSSIYLAAVGMYRIAPSFQEHLIIVPLSLVAGAVPFTPGGLGVTEVAMDKLYQIVPESVMDVSGVTVALAYRLITIAIASVGIVYYWLARKEVQDVLTEAEQTAT